MHITIAVISGSRSRGWVCQQHASAAAHTTIAGSSRGRAVKELEVHLTTSPLLAVEEAEAVDGTEEQAQGQYSTSLALTEEQELRGSTSYSVTNDANIASEVDSGQQQQRRFHRCTLLKNS